MEREKIKSQVFFSLFCGGTMEKTEDLQTSQSRSTTGLRHFLPFCFPVFRAVCGTIALQAKSRRPWWWPETGNEH